MLEKYLLKNLKIEEEVIKIIRRYSLTMFWTYFISILLIILAFFFIYPLFRLGWLGFFLFFFIIIFTIFFAVRKYILWSLDVFLITDQRIIDFDQKGLFNKNVTETTFDNIQDISYNKKGFFATFLDFGNIIVKTASQNSDLEFHKVKHPAEIQDLLVDCQNKFSNKKK